MSTALVNVHTALTKKQKSFVMAQAKKQKLPQAVIIRQAIEKEMARAVTKK